MRCGWGLSPHEQCTRGGTPTPALPRKRERERTVRVVRDLLSFASARALCASLRLMRSMGRRGSHRLRIRRRFDEKALITFPFHDPPPDRAMTVTNELRVEHRRAPGMPGCGRRRMRRAHDPSGLRGRRLRLRRQPQQQRGDAGGLRSQRELAAGDEIELARLPQTSSTTAPSASQASASAAVRNAASTSAARTVTSSRGSRPSSTSPLIDSAPDSISEKSCRTQTSGRRGVIRPARPAMNPVAAAL